MSGFNEKQLNDAGYFVLGKGQVGPERMTMVAPRGKGLPQAITNVRQTLQAVGVPSGLFTLGAIPFTLVLSKGGGKPTRSFD